MKSALFLLSLLLCACAPSQGPTILPGNNPPGLGFLPAQAEKGLLFKYYQPKGPSKWLNNWAANLNLTGVSFNDTRTATLISPSHVVMAAHYMRPSDVPVMFHDKNGTPHERYITAVRTLNTGDIAVGRLNMPVPAGVKWYRLANAGDATPGRPVITTDQTNSLSVHCVDSVRGAVVQLGYIKGLNPLYQRHLVVGDSGSPSFL
ncbi:MAG: hypothetical protein EOP85_14570, partial [Verrucomicrobiaceae bacterium]